MFLRLVDTDWIVVLNVLVIILGDSCKLYMVYKERRHTYMIYLRREFDFAESYLLEVRCLTS